MWYDTSYFYYRTPDYNVTLAYKRTRDFKNIVFGAAFCCPRDQFSKVTGRRIAEGRMNRYSHNANVPADATRTDVHDTILSLIAAHECEDYSPSQFKYLTI